MNVKGPPLFWITMNTNVHNNRFLITVLNSGIFEGYPNQETRLQAVSKNPTLLAIYFRRLVDAFLKYFIGFNTKTKTPYIGRGAIPSISHWMMACEEDRCKTLHFHFIAWPTGIQNIEDLFGPSSLCEKHRKFISREYFLDTLRLKHVKDYYTQTSSVQDENKNNFFDYHTPKKYSETKPNIRNNTDWIFHKIHSESDNPQNEKPVLKSKKKYRLQNDLHYIL